MPANDAEYQREYMRARRARDKEPELKEPELIERPVQGVPDAEIITTLQMQKAALEDEVRHLKRMLATQATSAGPWIPLFTPAPKTKKG